MFQMIVGVLFLLTNCNLFLIQEKNRIFPIETLSFIQTKAFELDLTFSDPFYLILRCQKIEQFLFDVGFSCFKM